MSEIGQGDSSIFSQLAEMGHLLLRGAWADVEGRFRQRCFEVDPAAANAIRNGNLSTWSDLLRGAAEETLLEAGRAEAAAVYWEFDPDNDWESAFFLCRRYTPTAGANDDWASDFSQALRGPSSASMAAIYDSTFDRSERAVAVNLYLFARTFAEFGRVVRPLWQTGRPLCAGYHDQSAVFRLIPDAHEEAAP
jgi:hypothetical protein